MFKYIVLIAMLGLSGCAGYIQAEWCLERNEEGECFVESN